jgi:hypothetical protein
MQRIMFNPRSIRPLPRWMIAVPLAMLSACGPTPEQKLQAELDQTRAELTQAQQNVRGLQMELEQARSKARAAANTRYVDDGPSLAPDEAPDADLSPPSGNGDGDGTIVQQNNSGGENSGNAG